MDLAMREDLEIAIEDFVDDNYEDAVVDMESIIEYEAGKYEAEVKIAKKIVDEDDASYFDGYDFDRVNFEKDFTPDTAEYSGNDSTFEITATITDIDYHDVRVKRRRIKGEPRTLAGPGTPDDIIVDASGEVIIYMTLDMIKRS